MSKIDPKKLIYEGCDLEAMAQAPNYYQWLIKIVRPYIGNKVVEVGAGAGSFSKELLKVKPKIAVFLEPTKNMYKILTNKLSKKKQKETKIITANKYLTDYQLELKKLQPNSFIYINVFEHIENDYQEISIAKKILKKGDYIIIFVPAHNALLSNFDRRIGHYRRYSKKSLRMLAQKADLDVVELRYMDIIGTIPWLINFKILKKNTLNPELVEVYDRFFIPVIRLVESKIKMPFGKNVLLVARKK